MFLYIAYKVGEAMDEVGRWYGFSVKDLFELQMEPFWL